MTVLSCMIMLECRAQSGFFLLRRQSKVCKMTILHTSTSVGRNTNTITHWQQVQLFFQRDKVV